MQRTWRYTDLQIERSLRQICLQATTSAHCNVLGCRVQCRTDHVNAVTPGCPQLQNIAQLRRLTELRIIAEELEEDDWNCVLHDENMVGVYELSPVTRLQHLSLPQLKGHMQLAHLPPAITNLARLDSDLLGAPCHMMNLQPLKSKSKSKSLLKTCPCILGFSST